MEPDEPPAELEDYNVALEWFRARVPLTQDEYRALIAAVTERAFTVAGVTQLELVTHVYEALERAIAEGTTLEDFKKAVSADLSDAWGEANSPRLETIFRTNLQQAYGAGRYEMATRPAVLRMRPYWKFSGVLDSRTSRICRPLNGTVLPAAHPFWDSHHPPLHHRCRSTVLTLTEAQAQAAGVSEDVPDADSAEGFGGPPSLDWEPDLSRFPPPLVAEMKNRTG